MKRLERLVSTTLILTLVLSFTSCKKNAPLETTLSETSVIEETLVDESEETTNGDEIEESIVDETTIVDESEVIDETSSTTTSSATPTPTNTPTPTPTNNGGSTTQPTSAPVVTQPTTAPTTAPTQPQPTSTPVPTTPPATPTPTPVPATPTPKPTIVRAYATLTYNYTEQTENGAVDGTDSITNIEVILSGANWVVSAAGDERYETVNAERHPGWVWKSDAIVDKNSVHDILWSDGVVTQSRIR